jgi:hypothetical protein
MEFRRRAYADGAWVREASAAYAAKSAIRRSRERAVAA